MLEESFSIAEGIVGCGVVLSAVDWNGPSFEGLNALSKRDEPSQCFLTTKAGLAASYYYAVYESVVNPWLCIENAWRRCCSDNLH